MSNSKLVFATNNLHKLEEVSKQLSEISILSLKEIDCAEEIPETGFTLQENALQKSTFVKEKYGFDCFADDTGLEIEALNGEPGVYSARYAGDDCSFDENMNKVLEAMETQINRKARFRTVISLLKDGESHFFEGIVNGMISTEKYGEKGFGYDPIFMPDGFGCSFAEMTIEEKNKISHRGLAVVKLIEFLNKNA